MYTALHSNFNMLAYIPESPLQTVGTGTLVTKSLFLAFDILWVVPPKQLICGQVYAHSSHWLE